MPEEKPAGDIPDLKKVAEERFAWAPDALLQRTESAPVGKASASASALLAKLKSTILGRIAVLAVLVGLGFGLGLGVLGLSCLEIVEAKPAGRSGLGAITSRLRVRPGARDRLRYLISKGEVFFAPFRGAKATNAGEAAGEAAIPEPGNVDVELNFDSPPADNRSGGFASAGAPSSSSGGGSGVKTPSARGGAASKFIESAGKLNVKAVKKGRVTRTALASSGDRRDNTTKKGDFSRAVTPAIAAARGTDTQSPAAPPKSGLDFLLGGSGAPGGAPALESGSEPRSGGGARGGSSSAGGGSDGEPEETEDPNKKVEAINTLMQQSLKENEKANDEMRKAELLAAAGQLPQAHYHYNRAEKAKKKAKEYSDQAQAMTEAIAAQYQEKPQAPNGPR